MHTLAIILAQSLAKNGDKPLTIGHLLNIVNMAIKQDERRANKEALDLDNHYNALLADECGDRD